MPEQDSKRDFRHGKAERVSGIDVTADTFGDTRHVLRVEPFRPVHQEAEREKTASILAQMA